ncbi:Gfo/Idh/MocA family protein [Laspinema olomoucense]|uniref:Gfo/Idh/MocA family protein n=1 Tax=Laspinema olomoucense TaxID=3231600 RepID=UPI0021BB4454|nr:Gfo/Idh/MocA family oxidoreductase [Laspinema sp. D3c]MCT7995221.1 Gfo/Idh/MocA family oxidoreductase [Laspinema sp. D3c]
MTYPCKVAIVGAGYMADEHIKAFRDIPGVELSGIFSRTYERAGNLAKKWSIQKVCRSIDELYNNTRADLVIVTVPELATKSVVQQCFGYSWTCLIEKPVGYNLTEAEAITQSAQISGAKAFVALNRRHYSSTLAMLNDLAKNSEPRLIQIQDQQDAISALKAGQPEEVVANWMYANSIHLIDYLSILGRGKVTEIQSLIPWTPQDPRYVATKIQFDSGDIGFYQGVWNAPGPWAVSVTTPSKRWEMRPLEKGFYQPYGSRQLEPVEIDSWDQQFKAGLRRQAQLAIRAASGESIPELPTLEDALASMRLVQAIYGI